MGLSGQGQAKKYEEERKGIEHWHAEEGTDEVSQSGESSRDSSRIMPDFAPDPEEENGENSQHVEDGGGDAEEGGPGQNFVVGVSPADGPHHEIGDSFTAETE